MHAFSVRPLCNRNDCERSDPDLSMERVPKSPFLTSARGFLRTVSISRQRDSSLPSSSDVFLRPSVRLYITDGSLHVLDRCASHRDVCHLVRLVEILDLSSEIDAFGLGRRD